MAWWQYIVRLLYFVLLPALWLIEHLIALLSLLLAPLLHVLSYAAHAVALPFRLLAKLETLYVYFGTAILLGLSTGLLLYASTKLIGPLLGTRARTTTKAALAYGGTADASASDDEADASGMDDRHAAHAADTVDGGHGMATGRTAASFNAERAERRARQAREQAILGLSQVHGKGRGRTARGKASGASSEGSKFEDGVFMLDDSDWAAGRDLGPPTPMMGTMILEEEDSWSD